MPFALKMKQKSVCKVLSVQQEDPSKTEGMTAVLKSFLPYIPVISECKNVRAKTAIQGIIFKFRCRCRVVQVCRFTCV